MESNNSINSINNYLYSTNDDTHRNPKIFNNPAVSFQLYTITFPLETAKKFILAYNTLILSGTTPCLLDLIVKPLFSDEVVKLLDSISHQLNLAIYGNSKPEQFITIQPIHFVTNNITEKEFNDLMYIIINYMEDRTKYDVDYNNKYIEYFERISSSKISASFLRRLSRNYWLYNVKSLHYTSHKYIFNDNRILKKIFNTDRQYRRLLNILFLAYTNEETVSIRELQKLENRDFQKFKKLFLDITFLNNFLKNFELQNKKTDSELNDLNL